MKHTCSHDLNHLLADAADLAALGVASLADLVRASLGERQSKQAQLVAIGRGHIGAGLNQSLPLANKAIKLVAGDVHAIESGQESLALHLLADQLDLAVVEVLGAVKIGQGNLENAALQGVRRDLCKY